VESLGRRNVGLISKIEKISKLYGLSVKQVCDALDEVGIWYEDGTADLERFQLIASEIAKISQNDVGATFRLHRVPPLDQDISVRHALEVPDRYRDLEYQKIILKSPIPEILETLLDDPRHVVYVHLFEKFEVNYKIPNAVIRAIIHYMIVHNRAWSTSYLETVATDLLINRVTSFDQAMDHFAKRLSWTKSIG
jgi:replication initiation and membrane attachment protein DnaB